MEAGWSARRVTRPLGRSDCVANRREDPHIARNARVQPTASSTAIQVQVAPTIGAPVSSRTIRMRLTEGHLGSWHPIRVLPLTPTHRHLRLELCRVRGNWTAAEWNQVVFSDESDSISAVMTIVFVCGDPVVNASILPLLYSWCDGMGCH
ncbi:HTH_Tnp_Tc3_2 domain-containing protein [Trichonephila clavipes]|nr:HTH_Tnp_Tc3_2 domain-containing protein [Trichonephila clavipes]